MNTKELNGGLYKKLLIAGYENLRAHAETVNELNVFPIPDGDTGDNMCATMTGGIAAVSEVVDYSLDTIASLASHGMLLGARGNSGVILSQMFAGIASALRGVDSADIFTIVNAFRQGVKCAYNSVNKPVEGTMLTVLREGTELAAANVTPNTTLETFFDDYLAATKMSLEKTPDLLDVLKEAGVIDSGGAGVLYIFEGFVKALHGEEVKYENDKLDSKTVNYDFSKFNADSEMKYGYCTELLLQLQNSKVHIPSFSVENLVEFLSTIGDSIVAFISGTVVKVHVHTMKPYKVLEYCQQYGEFLTVKIENMTLQHNETLVKKEVKEPKYKMNPKHKKYGIVTVTTGSGLHELFKQMEVDVVIDGGQGKSPSVEDFLEAFAAVNADEIFVLPNNSNIIMAAKEAKALYEKAKVRIIESKNIGQAYAALSMLDYGDLDGDTIEQQLVESIRSAVVGMVSRAIRTATIDNVDIKKDEYIGFSDKKILVSYPSKIQTACELLGTLKADESECLIAIYGEGVTAEEKEQLRNYIKTQHRNVEYYDMNGEQEVYDLVLLLQ